MKKLAVEFVGIFEQYIKPVIISCFKEDEEARSLWYTIESGRNRFRSGLAYLLSGKTSLGIAIGAASEIAWASILVLDDIGDVTTIRRGKKAAWKKYGLLEASHAAALGFLLSSNVLKIGGAEKPLIDSLNTSISLTLKAQIEQRRFSQSSTVKTVLESYIRKTALGRWALEAATKTNVSISESDKEKMVEYFESTAILAQIKNDLDDIKVNPEDDEYEPSMKDFQEKTITYPIVLFLSLASDSDKNVFIKRFWEQTYNKEVDQLALAMFDKYNIYERGEEEISQRILFSQNLIRSIPNKYKELLVNWVKEYKPV